MSDKDKHDEKLADLLREKPFFKEIISEAESKNDQGYIIAEFSSYQEITELVKLETEIIGARYQNPEVLQNIIATMEQLGIIEIEDFDKETGYLRGKYFLPSSFFEESKN